MHTLFSCRPSVTSLLSASALHERTRRTCNVPHVMLCRSDTALDRQVDSRRGGLAVVAHTALTAAARQKDVSLGPRPSSAGASIARSLGVSLGSRLRAPTPWRQPRRGAADRWVVASRPRLSAAP